ncbi:hypothetical protein DPEC_G00333150 [Dallia pectoralis]|uniref:Uncharacterized protein n=1 Tax=Dallia pectoralis TaxID=75939 RepID=A0ACC2F6C0_DALPE|nr:hypothetical protein DPEC_G00333150 [Dallia pectoralis]
MKQLLVWIRENLLKERPELFVQGDTVRPGILVLINDADWELMGELRYELRHQDNVVFISTLHGVPTTCVRCLNPCSKRSLQRNECIQGERCSEQTAGHTVLPSKRAEGHGRSI